MAIITNATVVFFSNEYLRPISEAARNLRLRLDDAKTEYTTNIASLIAGNADADTLGDGAPGDGRTVVTKKDITDFIAILAAILTEFNTAGNEALISKFTVRAPKLRAD